MALFKVDIGLQETGIAWVRAWCWSTPVFERVPLAKGPVTLVKRCRRAPVAVVKATIWELSKSEKSVACDLCK